MNIHKGDTVKIISGKDRGKTGKILKALPERKAVLIEGINTYKKHRRPKKQGEKGEVVTVIRPMKAAKVMIVCSSCKEAARAGYRLEGDKKIRICKKCEGQM